jgi:hypothetical protein
MPGFLSSFSPLSYIDVFTVPGSIMTTSMPNNITQALLRMDSEGTVQFDTLLPHRLGTAAKPSDHSRPVDGNGYKRSRNFVLESWQRACTCLTIAGRVAHLCIAPFPRRVPHPCVFCKGGRRCCRRNSCPFYTTRCVCRRRTRPSPTRRTGHPHLWWLLQFESRATRPAHA